MSDNKDLMIGLGLAKIRVEGQVDEYATFCRDRISGKLRYEGESEYDTKECGMYLNDNEVFHLRILLSFPLWSDREEEKDLTPLVRCIIDNQAPVIRLLLEIGVDVNYKCRSKSPLEWAKNSTGEIRQILIKVGAKE